MKTYVLALDLKNDPNLISQYEEYHKHVWPEIIKSITDSGIQECVIYRISNRLIMQLTTTNEFSFENKSALDNTNSKVLEWETVMWNFQQAIPGFPPNEKWQLCEEIFRLSDNL